MPPRVPQASLLHNFTHFSSLLSSPLSHEEQLSVPAMEQARDCPRAFAYAVSAPRILFLDLVSLLYWISSLSLVVMGAPEELEWLDRQLDKLAGDRRLGV